MVGLQNKTGNFLPVILVLNILNYIILNYLSFFKKEIISFIPALAV